jgi:sugar lactone lactonase YvrE
VPAFGQTIVYGFTNFVGHPGSPGSVDGTNSNARFSYPSGIAVDSAGNFYVADTGNSTVRKVTRNGTNWLVTTLAGKARSPGEVNGIGSAARFIQPSAIAVDSAGNLFVTDSLTIRKVTPVGTNWVVTTVAGKAGTLGSTDGLDSGARFNTPSGIAVDSAGSVFIADSGNCTIRKMIPLGTNWLVTTLAGKAGAIGYTDGIGSAARFFHPSGLTVDSAGNVFVAEPEIYGIRKVTPAGVVTTVASGREDSEPPFGSLAGMAVDSAGDLFVTDESYNLIRMVSPEGVVTVVAGSQAGYANGVGSKAQFSQPSGIVVDSAGNLFVADMGNSRITQGTPTVSIQPPTLARYFDGENLYLAWPAENLGWVLEAQTNAAGAGLGTTWFPVTGSTNNTEFAITNLTNPGVFYRLRFP